MGSSDPRSPAATLSHNISQVSGGYH